MRWFRKKTIGYGWTPCTWQGWLATLLLVFACFGTADPELLQLDKSSRTACLVALVACFFVLVAATSGKDSDA